MADNLDTVFKEMDQQDIFRVTRRGLPEELVGRIRLLCEAYRGAQPEIREEMRTAVTAKATVVLLSFMTAITALAAQRKDKQALDLGLAALDLSNIMRIDPRDAFIPVAQLAFAAIQCGIEPGERASRVLPDISPRLLEMFRYEQPPTILLQDSAGNPVFRHPRPPRPVSGRPRRQR